MTTRKTTKRSKVRRRREPSLILDQATSGRMGRVRQKDTAAELVVRRLLTDHRHRYRIRNRDLPGSPDVANRKRRWAVFVHGCFWHRHQGCYRTTSPHRNREFWENKFLANVARDARAARSLKKMGYKVVTVWECETFDAEKLRTRLGRLL